MARPIRWAVLGLIARQARSASLPGAPSLTSRLLSVPRLFRGVVSGEYREVPAGRLLAMAVAVLYVLSPIDAFPEAVIPLLGFADDAVVIGWIAATLNRETEAFLGWERIGRNTVVSSVV
ncbi:MAG TPA: YkvA family protein [Dermatophilaceae bacterium]|nr:YkvA family protein [Dermatophilaceae bacterium]